MSVGKQYATTASSPKEVVEVEEEDFFDFLKVIY